MPIRWQNFTEFGSPPCSPQMPTFSELRAERPCSVPMNHQLPHAILVQTQEGVLFEDALFDICRQEFSGVVARISEGHLGEVVRAEAEEIGGLRDGAGHERRPGNFDHRADEIVDLDSAPGHDFFGHTVHDLAEFGELLDGAHKGDHDFGNDFDPPLAHVEGRFKNGARLHFVYFRIGYAKAAAPVPQHGVELMQAVHFLADRSEREPPSAGPFPAAVRARGAQTRAEAGPADGW